MGPFVWNLLNINCVCVRALYAHIMEVRGQFTGISSPLPCGSHELGYQVWQQALLPFWPFHQPSIFFFKKVYLTFMVYMCERVGACLRFWGHWTQLIWRQYGTWLLCSCYWLLTDLAESQTTLQFYFFKESNQLWAAFSKAHCSRITCLFPDLLRKQAIKFDPAPKVKLGKVNPHTRPEYLVDYELTLANFLTGYRSSMIPPA